MSQSVLGHGRRPVAALPPASRLVDAMQCLCCLIQGQWVHMAAPHLEPDTGVHALPVVAG